MMRENGLSLLILFKIDLKDHSSRAKGTRSFQLQLLLIFTFLAVICSAGTALGNDHEKYLADLKSADVTIRIKAATELGKSHDTDGVKTALKDPDKKVRKAAINNLSILTPRMQQQKDPEAVALFVQSLKDTEHEVRYAALYRLRDYQIDASFGRHDTDPDICREIAGLFHDPSEHIRFEAILMVENCRIKESEEGLWKVANDKKEIIRIRRAAIMSLGHSRTNGMAQKIMCFMEVGEEKELRTAAVYSLGLLKHSDAVPMIIPYVYDTDSQTRHTAVIALGMIGDPRGADALADVLITKDGKIGDFVLDSLTKASSGSALPKLVKAKPLLRDSGERAKYIDALAASKSDNAIPYLLELFTDKDFTAVQYLISRGLEKFESEFALKAIMAASKNDPPNKTLAALAEKAKRKLEFPEEAAREKQKQKEDASVQAKEHEINQIYATGARIFREKKYEKAIPFFYDAVDQFEKLYASYPGHFRSSSNQIRTIRSTLAEYYLWKTKDARKAAVEYEKLISVLDLYEKDKRAIIPYYFAVGEIYEKDLKDYKRAFTVYSRAAAQPANKDKRDSEMEILSNWYFDWIAFLSEKISVQNLKQQKAFSHRTLKYPNYSYGFFTSLGVPLPGFLPGFDQDDFIMTGEEQASKELFDKVYARYPERYRMLWIGIGLFQQFVKQKKYDNAEYMAKKIIHLYPDDLNSVMLQFGLADLYKMQSNDGKYKEQIAIGKAMANALNIEIILGPDERFATPEKTWQLFVELLKKGDIDTAIECFSPTSQQKYKETFTALKDHLPKIAADMGKIRKIKEPQDGRAEYDILKNENGKVYSFALYFVDIFGEWKIEQF
jgi:HEAT repeat protein